MLIQELKAILEDQAHTFQETFFSNTSANNTVLFEHTNHDVLLQIFVSKSFSVRITCISNIFHV